ncbi:MAG: hypothetical protein RLZZ337_1900, partial [Bacteroidota bacterium]
VTKADKLEIKNGIMEDEAKLLMQTFFERKR